MSELKSKQMKKVDIVSELIEKLSFDTSARDHFLFLCHLKQNIIEDCKNMLEIIEYKESGQFAEEEKTLRDEIEASGGFEKDENGIPQWKKDAEKAEKEYEEFKNKARQ